MKVEVIFVCLGNICRSPAAEGILKDLHRKETGAVDLVVESAGTGGWHVGELPDRRMRDAAQQRGLILDSRAQQFQGPFFDRFHYILAADQSVFEDLLALAEHEGHREKLFLFTHFSESNQGEDVPDPYYGGDQGFHHVLDLLEDACQGLLQHIHETERKRG